MACKVLELGIVSVGHDSNVRKAFREEVSEPHDLGLLVRPCVEGMAIKAMDGNETRFSVRIPQLYLRERTCSKTIC